VVASEIDAGGRACRYKHSLKTTFLTTGVNFTNILWAVLAHIDPKSAKIHWWLDYLSAPWGSAQIKAVSKHDVEINPRCQFHQHFTSRFYVRKCFSLLSSHHSLAL